MPYEAPHCRYPDPVSPPGGGGQNPQVVGCSLGYLLYDEYTICIKNVIVIPCPFRLGMDQQLIMGNREFETLKKENRI